jgi:hypothetical protein
MHSGKSRPGKRSTWFTRSGSSGGENRHQRITLPDTTPVGLFTSVIARHTGTEESSRLRFTGLMNRVVATILCKHNGTALRERMHYRVPFDQPAPSTVAFQAIYGCYGPAPGMSVLDTAFGSIFSKSAMNRYHKDLVAGDSGEPAFTANRTRPIDASWFFCPRGRKAVSKNPSVSSGADPHKGF